MIKSLLIFIYSHVLNNIQIRTYDLKDVGFIKFDGNNYTINITVHPDEFKKIVNDQKFKNVVEFLEKENKTYDQVIKKLDDLFYVPHLKENILTKEDIEHYIKQFFRVK